MSTTLRVMLIVIPPKPVPPEVVICVLAAKICSVVTALDVGVLYPLPSLPPPLQLFGPSEAEEKTAVSGGQVSTANSIKPLYSVQYIHIMHVFIYQPM